MLAVPISTLSDQELKSLYSYVVCAEALSQGVEFNKDLLISAANSIMDGPMLTMFRSYTEHKGWSQMTFMEVLERDYGHILDQFKQHFNL